MCERFTITWDAWRRVAETLRIDDDGDVAASYRPRFNIAPTDQHFIVTHVWDEYQFDDRGRATSWAAL
jgi:putative SOS response-associated peptidase YedK